MANTAYITENRLTIESSNIRKNILIIGIPVTLLLCLVFFDMWWWFSAALLIIYLNAGARLRAGASGEDNTLTILSTLPDSYTIFNQTYIPAKNSKTGYAEIDFIVVGPNGCFAIEVKNNNSEIIGSENERRWRVNKIGRRGTPYSSSLGNPIKQVKWQIWALSNYLKNQKQNTWIQGIVFFSNPNSSLQFKGSSSVPIFHVTGIVEYILNYTPKIMPRNIDKVTKLLAKAKQKHIPS